MKRLSWIAPPLVAGIAACLLSLPLSSSAGFIRGGVNDCNSNNRKDIECPSISSGECKKMHKVCNTSKTDVSYCTDGTGVQALGCNNTNGCGTANHATDDPNCKKPGG